MSWPEPQVPTSARLVPALDPSRQTPFRTSGVSCSCQAISDAVFVLKIMLISFFLNGYVHVFASLSHGLLVPRKYHVILAIIPTQKYPKTSAEQRESGRFTTTHWCITRVKWYVNIMLIAYYLGYIPQDSVITDLEKKKVMISHTFISIPSQDIFFSSKLMIFTIKLLFFCFMMIPFLSMIKT